MLWRRAWPAGHPRLACFLLQNCPSVPALRHLVAYATQDPSRGLKTHSFVAPVAAVGAGGLAAAAAAAAAAALARYGLVHHLHAVACKWLYDWGGGEGR